MANKRISGDVNVEFNEAQSRQSLESGESVKTLFGKLRKWLTDLKPVAFSGSYNDLSYIPVNKAGDTMTGDLHFSDDDSASLDIGYDSSPDLFKIWSLHKDIDIESGENVYICGGGSGNGVVIDGAVFFKGTLSSSGATDIRVLAIDVSNRGKLMKLNNSELADKVPAVRYDTSSQGLTATQKSNARTNLGLGSAATYSSSSFASSTQGGYATDFNSNFKPIFATSGQSHASVFRGKYIGSSFTSAQKAAIADVSFTDLYVGDYWTINGVNWRIADINYYLHTGDTETTAPHLVVVPDKVLGTSYMNSTNTTTGAYVGSYMYTTTLLQNGTEASSSIFGQIKAAFGESNLLSIRQYFANAADSSGYASGASWYSTRCFLMNQCMVYGHVAWGYGNYNNGFNVGIDKTQLA
jgi:hypothetical protein